MRHRAEGIQIEHLDHVLMQTIFQFMMVGGQIVPVDLFHCEHRVYLPSFSPNQPNHADPLHTAPKLGRYRPRSELFLLDSFPTVVPLTAALSPKSSSPLFRYHCPIGVLAAMLVSGFP